MREPERFLLAHGFMLPADKGDYIRADDPAYLLMRRKASAFDAIELGMVNFVYDASCNEFAAYPEGKRIGESKYAERLIDAIEAAMKEEPK